MRRQYDSLYIAWDTRDQHRGNMAAGDGSEGTLPGDALLLRARKSHSL
jgi:hypothetical protein